MPEIVEGDPRDAGSLHDLPEVPAHDVVRMEGLAVRLAEHEAVIIVVGAE